MKLWTREKDWRRWMGAWMSQAKDTERAEVVETLKWPCLWSQGAQTIHHPHLAAMSSSSPPQPQYWLGKPFIFIYWSGVTADTPPKYCGYGSLGGSYHIIIYLSMCPHRASPVMWVHTVLFFFTCIWTCPWPQTGVWGTVCGRCRCCGRSQAASQRHARICSSSLHLWEPPAPQR